MTARTGRRPRDPRLDFFRGLAMFIIVIAHVRDNPWTLWIPARFGFSDAAEIFVFCSGMASALAFGAVFARSGYGIGTMRVALRVWQVYWAHVCTFLVIAAVSIAQTAWLPSGVDYLRQLNLHRFFEAPEANLVGLMTLTYVPNYFDILPMYLVILAMIPAAVALGRLNPALLGLASIALWLAANLGLNLPAEPWSDRPWFFNPFGWQLLFFTGFAFMSGWLRPPPVNRTLIALAAAVVVLSVPFAWFRVLGASETLREAAGAIRPLTDKTPLGLLRLIHFLALAYLGWVAAGAMGARLTATPARARVAAVIMQVGQQSLAVFISGLVLSRLLGGILDLTGRGMFAALCVNLLGVTCVIALARFVGWIKSPPWARPAQPERRPSRPDHPGEARNPA